jgi:U5 small nuclear ribonucleoprotein component
MDEDLYDEFGNYIGPELGDSGDERGAPGGFHAAFDADEQDRFSEGEEGAYGSSGALALAGDAMDIDHGAENRIILHEDKKYYPDAEEVFPGVRTVTLDEDAQDLTEPIIKPIKVKNFSVLDKEPPSMRYSSEFQASLMNSPSLVRNIAIIGNFHHGKTMFVDTLVQSAHTEEWDPAKNTRYTDTRKDEQDRELSIKSTPISLVLESLTEKSYLLTVIDCPGHVNFADECTAGLRASDGAVIVVDAIEGVMMNTERLIKHAVDAKNALVLVSAHVLFSPSCI